MEFLHLRPWNQKGIMAHGFGRKDKIGTKIARKDWRRQDITVDCETFPLISLRQVHGDRVFIFDGSCQNPDELWDQEGDALICQVPGYALAVFTADCMPLFLFDPVRKAIGVVHAGWRGAAKSLPGKAVEKMIQNFHCRPENILAAIGPCIGPCCMEVDEPVRALFKEAGLPWNDFSSPRGAGKWLLDLPGACTHSLENAGVSRKNIQRLDFCTCCQRDMFFSYRGEAKTQGRQMNFIALKKEPRGELTGGTSNPESRIK
jgi:YfiH family protein